jgi:DnaJ-class molecular chaperone
MSEHDVNAPLAATDANAAKPCYYTCPRCGGTGDDPTIADLPCARCKGHGALTQCEMTPREIADAIRSREEDDRMRNKTDFEG